MRFVIPWFRNRRSAALDAERAREAILIALDEALGHQKPSIAFPIHQEATGESTVLLAMCQLNGCTIDSQSFATPELAYQFALRLTQSGQKLQKYPCPECYREYQEALYADAIQFEGE